MKRNEKKGQMISQDGPGQARLRLADDLGAGFHGETICIS